MGRSADVDCEDNLQLFIDLENTEEGYGCVVREERFLKFCTFSAHDVSIEMKL